MKKKGYIAPEIELVKVHLEQMIANSNKLTIDPDDPNAGDAPVSPEEGNPNGGFGAKDNNWEPIGGNLWED